MPPRAMTCAALYAALALLLLAPAQCADYSVGGNREVQHEMESLVDGVRAAVRDAERAHDGKEVLDLGQSLHILEHKFAGLKAAIAHEMGTGAAPKSVSHTEEAKQMVESASRLLDEMAGYRSDMERLMTSMREIEDSVQAAKGVMADFDRDVDEMNRLLSKLHGDTEDLHSHHHTANSLIEHTTSTVAGAGVQRRGHHKWYLLVLLVEAAAIIYWVYSTKKGALSAKSLHKF